MQEWKTEERDMEVVFPGYVEPEIVCSQWVGEESDELKLVIKKVFKKNFFFLK